MEKPKRGQHMRPAALDEPAQPPGTSDVQAGTGDTLAWRGENDEWYRALVRASGYITWVTPASGLMMGEQRAWCAYTGQSPEECASWGWLEAVHPDDRESARSAWETAIAARTPYETTFRLRRADGVFRWFLDRGVPLLDEAGTVREWAGFGTDITTQREAQAERERLLDEARQARAEAEERARELETLIETVADGVALFDNSGRVVRVNAAGRRLFGYESPGADTSDQFARLGLRNEHDEPFTTETWPLARLLRGEVLSGKAAVDMRRTLPEGTELAVNLTGTPLLGADGRVVGAVAVARDVTERRRLERQVAERASLLGAVFESMPDGVLIYDPKERLLYVNRAGKDILGLEEQASAKEMIAQFTARQPDGSPLLAEQWPVRRILGGETLLGDADDVLLDRPDGLAVRLNHSGAPVRDTAGGVLGAVLIIRDVTEQRRLEGEARATAEEAAAHAARLEAILEAIQDAVYVYDGAGRLTLTNAAARRVNPQTTQGNYLGRAFEERIGQFDLRDAEGRPLTPEDTPVSRIMRGEVLTAEHAFDTKMRMADGTEILLSTTGAPVRGPTGGVQGAVIVSRDVTERWRLERRTHEALEALLAMAELVVSPATAGEGPLDMTALGRRVAGMTAGVLGCERVALLAATSRAGALVPVAAVGLTAEEEARWRDGRPEGAYLRDTLTGEAQARLAKGDVVMIDYTRPPHDTLPNPHRVRELLLAPMRVGGEIVGLLNIDYGADVHSYSPEELRLVGAVAQLAALVVERDRLLREREEARGNELALREANRRMDEFLGIASHELKTPLTTVKMNLQLVDRRVRRLLGEATPVAPDLQTQMEPLHDLLLRAHGAADRQDRLVGDLLDVSRIQAGRLEMQTAQVDLNGVVRAAVEEQRLAHPDRHIALAGEAEAILVEADADRIGQVVTNYLTNALKYSTADKPVRVRLGSKGGAARVDVIDEGPGLPLEEQHYIWERFYRVPGLAHRSGSGVGLGLGLHISRTIVERHGGAVGVESAGGNGATFWFTLPLTQTVTGEN